jgi:hypothetical protein
LIEAEIIDRAAEALYNFVFPDAAASTANTVGTTATRGQRLASEKRQEQSSVWPLRREH